MGRLAFLVPLTALIVLAPVATAHFTITVTPPANPIPWNQATTVNLEVSVSCVDVVSEFQGEANFEFALKADTKPAWLTATGSEATIHADEPDFCDLEAQTATTTGTITLAPSVLAPGLQSVTVEVVSGESGSEPPATFPVIISYRGEVAPMVMAAGMAGHIMPGMAGGSVPVHEGNGTAKLMLNLTTNADSTATITVKTPPKHGTLTGLPPNFEVSSPIRDSRTSRETTLDFKYAQKAGNNATSDQVVLTIQLKSKSDATKVGQAVDITIPFTIASHAHDEHEHEDEESTGFLPSTTLPVVLLGVAVIAMVLRRRL